jgi:hypothetical protein
MANWLSLPNKFYIELNLLIDCDISTNSLIVCYSNTDWTYSHYRSIAISILNEYTIIYWLVIYHYIPCRPGIQNSVIVHDFNTNGDIQTVTSLLSEYTNCYLNTNGTIQTVTSLLSKYTNCYLNTNGTIQTVTSLLSEYTNLLTAYTIITDWLLPDIYNYYWWFVTSILTGWYTITDQHTTLVILLLHLYWQTIQSSLIIGLLQYCVSILTCNLNCDCYGYIHFKWSYQPLYVL